MPHEEAASAVPSTSLKNKRQNKNFNREQELNLHNSDLSQQHNISQTVFCHVDTI